MTAAERLYELRRELARAEREPATYAGNAELRWLAEAIRATEAELEITSKQEVVSGLQRAPPRHRS